MLTRTLILKLADRPSIRNWITRGTLARGLVKRFIAGDDVESAFAVARELNAKGFRVTLNYLGEHTTSVQESESATRQYVFLLDQIATAGVKASISVKLTQLGLGFDPALCRTHLERVLQIASDRQNFVWIDMESSAYTEPTLNLFYEVFPLYRNVGAVLQSYLYRTPQDLDRLLQLGARVRLTKGAYAEPASVAYPRKRDVDRQFLILMERLLREGNEPAIATHDARLIKHAKQYAMQIGLSKERMEFQLIYGVRRDLQDRLVKEGYPTLIYVPYGDQWYSYFVRRLAERPANLYFLLRHLWRR